MTSRPRHFQAHSRAASGTLTQLASGTLTLPRAVFGLWGLQTFSAKIPFKLRRVCLSEFGRKVGGRRDEAETSCGGGEGGV